MRRFDDLTMCAKILGNDCLNTARIRYRPTANPNPMNFLGSNATMLLLLLLLLQNINLRSVLLVEVACIDLHIEHRIEVDALHSDSP